MPCLCLIATPKSAARITSRASKIAACALPRRSKRAASGPSACSSAPVRTGCFVALARVDRKYAVIVSPKFGEEGDFVFELLDELDYEREEVFEKGSGLNGAFGFGKKGAKGFNLHLNIDGQRA